MIFITTDTWENNDVEVITVDKIKWLNEKNIEKKLVHSNLTMITAKYSGDDRRKKDKYYKIVPNLSLPEYL